MKTIKIFLICMTAAIFVQAQNIPPHTLSEVEVIPPKFTAQKAVNWEKGASVDDYIAENFRFPDVRGIPQEGTGVVQFVITENGAVDNFVVINSVSKEVDEEIIRVLQKTNHMWMPGQMNGEYSAMEKEIAVQVKVGTSEANASNRDFTKIAEAYFTKGGEKLFVKQKTRQALHQFESAIRYKPYDEGSLFMLALCKIELGKIEDAQKDIARLKKLGGTEALFPEQLAEDVKRFESYDELIAQLTTR